MVHAVVSLFCKREDISFETFKEILEGEFVPLLEKLTGPLFPMTYTRRYMAHEDNARERSRAGPLGMPSLIVGSAETVTWDAIVEATFEDDLHLQQFMAFLNEEEVADQLMTCETKFSDSTKLRIMIMENRVSVSKTRGLKEWE